MFLSPSLKDINHLKAGLVSGVITSAIIHLFDGHANRFARSVDFISGFKGGLAMFRPGFAASSFFATVHVVMPSVGMYFTVYEYLKNNAFYVEDRHSKPFTQIASWMASAAAAAYVGHMLANPSMLIPARYAVQFGVFESTKEIYRYYGKEKTSAPRHLGFFPIVGTATLGGIAAHSFVYPISQIIKKMKSLEVESAAITQPIAKFQGSAANLAVLDSTTVFRKTFYECGVLSRIKSTLEQITLKQIYAGWLPAMKRFLPPCVVTATSYEFALRYISKRDNIHCC